MNTLGKEGLRTISLDRIRPLLDRRKVIDAVRAALIWQAQGRVQSPLPGQLLFSQPPGDCHIKFGHVQGRSTFTIKVATGFYENPAVGLPVNHGLVLVFDAATGAPRVLFDDEGWLTAWRTAAAAAIAAHVAAPATPTPIGVVGTGLQANLAIEWMPETLGARSFVVWGRTLEKAKRMAKEHTAAGRDVRAVARLDDLFEACRLVVTATPSTEPLFTAEQIRPGTHLVALGADSPGKQELPAAAFARAAHIYTDDSTQCVDHGDLGAAVRASVVGDDCDVMIGHVLSGHPTGRRRPNDITIADLTGIAAEDIAIAGLFSDLLDE